jgi:DNA-binding Lrp family transcriptional regulator
MDRANFNDVQERVFKRLTSKQGRQKLVKIAIEENLSTSTVSRIIKQIKKKIMKVI